MKETLNEEQSKGAARDARTGFDYPLWAVATKTVLRDKDGNGLPPKSGLIETERWVDARAFACRIFGVSEVIIERHQANGEKPVPRWQVRMNGHASNGNVIVMQGRLIETNAPEHEPEWTDIRSL